MKKGFINILLYLFVPTILGILFYPYTKINKFTYFISNIIPYLVLLIYYILIYKKIIIQYYKKLNKKNILNTLIIWIIGFIIMLFANYIINYIIIPNGISNNELGNRNLLLEHKFTYSLLFCTIIPILEEISFRLEFKHNIKNKYIFLLVSSLTFSLIHIISTTSLIELLYIIPYLILGITFSYTYIKTNNLICSIIAHILHNTITVLIILFI